MLELLGIVFGGASRLFQGWMESRDKQAERDHEYRMFEHQIKLAEQRFQADAALRQMDLAAQQDKGDADALIAALQSQASEAQAAGGWAAAISASVRPMISYWLMGIYTVSKVATLWMSTQSGVPFAQAVVAAYSSFDGALLGSIVSFWFADRSLRKLR